MAAGGVMRTLPEHYGILAERLVGWFRLQVGDRALAEDLVQDTFLKTWRAKRDEPIYAEYVRTAARTTLAGHRRRVLPRGTVRSLEALAPHEQPGTFDRSEADDLEDLLDVLRPLPDLQAGAAVERLRGRSLLEIAAELGVGGDARVRMAAVKTLLAEAGATLGAAA